MRHEQNAIEYERSGHEMNKVLQNIKNENTMSKKINAYEERKIIGRRSCSSLKETTTTPSNRNDKCDKSCGVTETLFSRADLMPVLWDRHQYGEKLKDAIKLGNPQLESDLKKCKSVSIFDMTGKNTETLKKTSTIAQASANTKVNKLIKEIEKTFGKKYAKMRSVNKMVCTNSDIETAEFNSI